MENREFRDYKQEIDESINDIYSFIEGFSFDDFLNDRKTFIAVVRSYEKTRHRIQHRPFYFQL